MGTVTLNEGQRVDSKHHTEQTDVRQAVREQISKSLGVKRQNLNNSEFSKNPLFAGTQPLNEEIKTPGVDITSLPGIQNWGKIANASKKG